MKKTWASLIILLISVFVITGCSSSTSGGKQTTIQFVHWRGEDTAAFKGIISKFEKENPSIKVDMKVYPSDSYQAQVQATLLSGKGADVFASFPGSQFATLQKAGVYEDLTGKSFVKSFKDDLLAAGQADNKQLALPYQLVYNIPVYNKGIFEKEGIDVPKDWDSFLAACEKLKKAGYIPIAFSGDISPSQFINPMMMNNQPDEKVFEKLEKGEESLTNEWYVKTLSQIKELQDKGYFQKDPLGTKKDGAAVLFAQEKAAMLAHGSYMMATVAQQNPTIKQGLLAPITVSEDQKVYDGIHTATFMLGVNAKSAHKKAAEKFLSYLTESKVASEYANKTGQLLTLNDVSYDSKELEESAKWLDKKTRFQPRFTITKEPISKAIEVSVQDVISGMSPEKAAEKAQEEVKRALQ
ncbi:ABC transporter substrate-binding protein [Priestia koreensis]|uniref:ABC transporter substrate-binding protein n=1 Tax=Priestia koreensis TaxID=284581 RepID=UPI00203FEEEF|nr:ABC transporter substrate-binding protein [Priestia koreensis]MCM3006208.1 ABC transporter substrate-binding protein [Priestia koreensis]